MTPTTRVSADGLLAAESGVRRPILLHHRSGRGPAAATGADAGGAARAAPRHRPARPLSVLRDAQRGGAAAAGGRHGRRVCAAAARRR